MSSCVFFRFKSQKEPARVAFDGTGISVFELKREIISLNKLGDGTDFELIISSNDDGTEYGDDTEIISRGTTVIAKRLPAMRPGRGGAARYVSGKMPNHSKNSHRTETSTSKATPKAETLAQLDLNDAQTEEERIAAVMKFGADQWAQQEKEMAKVTPIHRGPIKGRPVNIPDRPPPPSYICYRCGEKGHYIQACPTNSDPSYDGRPRLKRTTGIPRSFLRTVEKPTAVVNDGTQEEKPSGVMVNADGDWVVAEPDAKTWERFQAKTRVTAAAQEAAVLGSKELQDRGLECSIDNRLFVEPTKTPCCGTTYCHDCITNALLENDLRCPKCSTDSILIDNLVPDEEIIAKIRDYDVEKNGLDEEKAKSRSRTGSPKSPSDIKNPGSTTPTSIASSGSSTNSGKKRAADTELPNERNAPGRAVDAPQKAIKQDSSSQQAEAASSLPANTFVFPIGMNMAIPNDQMGFIGGMPYDASIWGSFNMPNTSFMGAAASTWEPSLNFFPQQTSNLPNMSFQNGIMTTNGNFGQQAQNGYTQQQIPQNGFMNVGVNNNRSLGTFSNQQRNTFSAPMVNEEDSAYFRKPVNPHRHQARRNTNRPTDYREI